ncbi:hypothetical protein TSUD_260900 [Trifolium subterraneum]|uniref:Uncharacterized protein n=1 Tax=Trifolium subterraneum TaxID=3900 RepID=A0A2Z6MG81_TRISU|nr:hypothetical protein TSUD_260900 [Trifolium subterraneum]
MTSCDLLIERLLKCIEKVSLSSVVTGKDSSASFVPNVPQSTIGVLDALCISQKSDDTNVGVGGGDSCSSSHISSQMLRGES